MDKKNPQGKPKTAPMPKVNEATFRFDVNGLTYMIDSLNKEMIEAYCLNDFEIRPWVQGDQPTSEDMAEAGVKILTKEQFETLGVSIEDLRGKVDPHGMAGRFDNLVDLKRALAAQYRDTGPSLADASARFKAVCKAKKWAEEDTEKLLYKLSQNGIYAAAGNTEGTSINNMNKLISMKSTGGVAKATAIAVCAALEIGGGFRLDHYIKIFGYKYIAEENTCVENISLMDYYGFPRSKRHTCYWVEYSFKYFSTVSAINRILRDRSRKSSSKKKAPKMNMKNDESLSYDLFATKTLENTLLYAGRVESLYTITPKTADIAGYFAAVCNGLSSIKEGKRMISKIMRDHMMVAVDNGCLLFLENNSEDNDLMHHLQNSSRIDVTDMNPTIANALLQNGVITQEEHDRFISKGGKAKAKKAKAKKKAKEESSEEEEESSGDATA